MRTTTTSVEVTCYNMPRGKLRAVSRMVGGYMSLVHVTLRRTFVVLAGVLLLLTFSLTSATDSVRAGTAIDVGSAYFCDPSYFFGVCETTVPLGTEVTWTFVDGSVHDVTECGTNWSKGSSCTGDGGPDWASPLQSSGTYVRTFDQVGVYYYLCTLHPGFMKGTINVIAGVGGVAELPDLASTGQLANETDNDRTVLAGAMLGAALVSMVVLGAVTLMIRHRS